MTTKANVPPANSGDRQTKRDSADHLAEAAVASPGTAIDTDLVWRYWKATWLGGDSNIRS